MQRKGLVYLALGALLLVVIGFLVARGERADTSLAPSGDDRLFPDLKSRLGEVDRVEVRKAGNELVAALERADGRWLVTNRDRYPADFEKVRDLLVALSEARTLERKTANPDYYETLGLREITDPQTSARLVEVIAGDDRFTLLVGKRAQGWKASYVRLPDANAASWVLDREITLQDETSRWLDEELIDIDLERVREVSHVAPDGARLRIHRDDANALFSVDDMPPGRELKYPEIPEVVADVLDDLRLEDVQRGDTLPVTDSGTYHAEFLTFDGLRIEARVAMADEQHYLQLSVAHEPGAAAVPESIADETDAIETAATGAAEMDAAEDEADEADEAGALAAGTGGETAQAGGDSAEGALQPADTAAEAARLQQRLDGWIFRIAEYRYRGFAKRLDELLKVEDSEPDPGQQT